MKILVITILTALVCITARAEQEGADFKYGERPKDSIFDPAEILSVKEQKEISEPLRNILETEDIDVLIVILPDIGEAPPEHVVRGFSEKWAKTKINAVVLYVPGAEGSPWIFPGELMSGAVKSDSIKETIDAAEKRAAAEPTDFGKVRAASIEAADTMRYWKGGAILMTEHRINRRLELQLEHERKERLFKLSAALGAAALIPLLTGFILIFIKLKQRGARRFPAVRKAARLGSPYSGGNSNCSKPIDNL